MYSRKLSFVISTSEIPSIELLFSDFFTSKTFLYFHNLLLLHFMSRLRVEKISLRRFASFGVEKEPGYVDYITPLCRYSLRRLLTTSLS